MKKLLLIISIPILFLTFMTTAYCASLNLSDGEHINVPPDISYEYERIGYSNGDNSSITHSSGINYADITIHVGYAENSTGTYNLSGGTVSSWQMDIGCYGTGTFTQTGGTNIMRDIDGNSNLYIGHYENASGAYYLHNGNLNTRALVVGTRGTGVLEHTNGTITARNSVLISYLPGSTGTYNLSGSGTVSTNVFTVGQEGNQANFNQSDGSVTANKFNVGGNYGVYANATYNLSGGSLEVGELNIRSDSGKTGEFNITDSSAQITVNSTQVLFENGAMFSAVAGSKMKLHGVDLIINSTDGSDLTGFSNLGLDITGGSELEPDYLEVAGIDVGISNLTASDFNSSNFHLNSLQVGQTDNDGYVQLSNSIDNQLASEETEALFLNDLYLTAGSTLDLNGYNIYIYNDFYNFGNVIENGGNIYLLNGNTVPEPASLILFGFTIVALIRKKHRS